MMMMMFISSVRIEVWIKISILRSFRRCRYLRKLICHVIVRVVESIRSVVTGKS